MQFFTECICNEICLISLWSYSLHCKICLVKEIFFMQLFWPINMLKETSINSVDKQQNG